MKEKTGNTKGALAYLLGWITGLYFLFTEKTDKFVRFHAMQSIIISGGITILMLIPFLGLLLSFIVGPLSFILWIFMMWKAYNGEYYKLPYIGDFAEKQLEKIK